MVGNSLACGEDEVYISVLKRNSATCFHQASESFLIQGRWNHTTKTLAKGGPLTEFKANKTFEFCLEKTVDLVYDLVLLDAYGMRYLFYRVETGMDGTMVRMWRCAARVDSSFSRAAV